MYTVTAFHGSAIRPDVLNAIVVDYLELERLRVFRRLLVIRFGVLILVTAVTGGILRWMSAFASWLAIGIFLTPPVWTSIVELRRARRLGWRLAELPAQAQLEVEPYRMEKIVKSS